MSVWIKQLTFNKKNRKYKYDWENNNNYRILHYYLIKFLLHRNRGSNFTLIYISFDARINFIKIVAIKALNNSFVSTNKPNMFNYK